MELNGTALRFAALGQPTRLELMRVLLAAGPNGLAAGEAAQQLGIAPSTLSFHLRALEQAGLIVARRLAAARSRQVHGQCRRARGPAERALCRAAKPHRDLREPAGCNAGPHRPQGAAG